MLTGGWTQRGRIRGLQCLAIAAAVLALGGASASAAPIDRASDHVALRAFDRYLRATLASIPAARRADERFIASVSARCRAAYPAAAHRLLALGPSDLCADSRAFAANPDVVPAGTRRWEARFARDSRATGRTAFAFGEVVGFFHGSRDVRVLKDIARLSKRLTPAEKSLTTAEDTRLLGALGLHS